MTAPAPPSSPPRSRLPWLAVAVVLLAAGAGAAWWFTRGPDVPPPPEPDLSLAEAEVAAAVRSAQDRVRASPGSADDWGNLGMVLLAHRFEADAVRALQVAEQLDPSNYRWPYLQGMVLVLSDPDGGLACLRRGVEAAPATRPEPKLRLAEALLDRGRVDEADRLADEVLAGRPKDPRANWVKVRAAADRGAWDVVLERADLCKDHPSCRRRAALLRGEALARRGESAAAEAELRAVDAIPAEPAWPDPVFELVEKLKTGTAARLARARALIKQGRAGDAVAVLEEAVARAPTDPEPLHMLGMLLNQAGDPAAALQVMTEHTRLFPDSVEGWFQLGVARFQVGDLKGAIAAFEKTTALKPDHLLALHNLGRSHAKLGNRAEARAAYDRALLCRPDHPPTLQALRDLDAGR